MKLNYIVWMLLAMQGIFSVTATGPAPSPACCTKTSTSRVRVTEIVKYIHQDKPLCPIRAIRLLLRNGITICFHPEDAWAKHVIKVLDRTTVSKVGSTSQTQTSTSLSPAKSKYNITHNNIAASLTTGNWKEPNITPRLIPKVHENTKSTGTMTDSTLFTTYISHTSQMPRTFQKIELKDTKRSESYDNRKQTAPVTSQNPVKKKKALEWTEHFC